jgi:hypothetical protein
MFTPAGAGVNKGTPGSQSGNMADGKGGSDCGESSCDASGNGERQFNFNFDFDFKLNRCTAESLL